MATYIAIAALVIVAALFTYIVTRPADYRVERSALIGAPGDFVHSIINDLRRWGEWSPYDRRDPEMKRSFEGPVAGHGAVYTWDGNSQVGAGRLTIVDSRPAELVAMKLEFFRPFKCTNEVNFRLAPADGGTRVSWIMDGRNTFFSKAISLVMSMDNMIGRDFEQGLANLKTLAEAHVPNVNAPATCDTSAKQPR